MINARTILATTLAVTTAAGVPALADDGDARRAQRQLEEARGFGVTGRAAGQTEARRGEPDEDTTVPRNEQRWRKILKQQSMN